ncbi:MAG: molybdopterin molybdenumtransferase MoeA, partial [Actinomycetota bacterium]
LVAALRGEPPPAAVGQARLRARVGGVDRDHRLVPVRVRDGEAEPAPHRGASMLRGLAGADALAVVAPGSGAVGDVVELLPLP